METPGANICSNDDTGTFSRANWLVGVRYNRSVGFLSVCHAFMGVMSASLQKRSIVRWHETTRWAISRIGRGKFMRGKTLNLAVGLYAGDIPCPALTVWRKCLLS
jgi:hypothetical protein